MPTHTIEYAAYPSPEALSAADLELLEAAGQATEFSYAPYSRFRVGAAARLLDGTIARGWNTENAAYPMCLCAEPAALAAAASLRPGVAVQAMAVTVRSASGPVDMPVSPCGACRQQLLEHEARFGSSVRLILRGDSGPVFAFNSAADLLPFGFAGSML